VVSLVQTRGAADLLGPGLAPLAGLGQFPGLRLSDLPKLRMFCLDQPADIPPAGWEIGLLTTPFV